MGRYDVDAGVEGEYEPGSRGRVLRNLKGIRSVTAMHQAEYEAIALAQFQYQDVLKANTRFDAAMLCTMHRDWLGDIYKWAGRYRRVEVAKGGFRWPPAALIPHHMVGFESGLLAECTPCLPGSIREVAAQVARVHAEFLLIHPFREGNGRMSRWLADSMISQANLPAPNYGFEGPGSLRQKRRYLHAVVQGYGQHYEPLRDFFVDAIERRLRELS